MEYLVLCPKCKTFETVWFFGFTLIPTKKFVQRKGEVYHDCNSSEPCRLFPKLKKIL